jgi:hypothetical protein
MAGPKKVNIHLIPTEGEYGGIYVLMRELITAHHEHLLDARIALAWRHGLKPNKDGQLVLGKAHKASDLSRELAAYDFVIMLNFDAWIQMEAPMRRALVDHELCHCQVAMDGDKVQMDTKGRKVYRIRKHDIEEFREIVARHGTYKKDLEDFVKAATKRNRPSLLDTPPSDTGLEIPA